jgi:glutamate dehydrogenase
LGLYRRVQEMALSQLAWFMRNARLTAGSLAQTVADFKAGISAVSASLDESLTPAAAHVRAASADEFVRAMILESLSRSIADLAPLSSAPDIVLIAAVKRL